MKQNVNCIEVQVLNESFSEKKYRTGKGGLHIFLCHALLSQC